jgi:hypothetical protein
MSVYHARKALSAVSVAMVTAAILVGIAYSPILLSRINYKGMNWLRLSNIGQAYGAASAIISGVALTGIAFSLLFQARQGRLDRIRAIRDRQVELLRIVLDDPKIYAPVIGLPPSSDEDEIRQFYFTTLWMNYSRLGYEAGVITESHLRKEIFPSAFGSAPVRNYWNTTSASWQQGAGHSRRDRRFARIAAEEYRKAMAQPHSQRTIITSQPKHVCHLSDRRGLQRATEIAVGAAVGAFIGVIFRRLK